LNRKFRIPLRVLAIRRHIAVLGHVAIRMATFERHLPVAGNDIDALAEDIVVLPQALTLGIIETDEAALGDRVKIAIRIKDDSPDGLRQSAPECPSLPQERVFGACEEVRTQP
jgi:hypothetical protein